MDDKNCVLFYDLEVSNHHSYVVEDVIVHNCHNLSRKAWEPLLKLTEDPPNFLFIAFCTTDPQSVPDTIKTRSYKVPLKPLKSREIEDLLNTVAELEGWTIQNDVFQGIVNAASGSARQALTFLQAGHTLQSREELSKVISEVESDDDPMIKLCQYWLSGGRSWKAVSQLLEKVDDEDAAITNAARYLTGAMKRSEEPQAQEIYRMIRSFVETTTYDKKVHLYTAVGKVMWGQLPF
jgi:DNA polymerase III gamma/tau subunit